MTKGENDFEDLGLPPSPKGEIVGILVKVWSYGTGVVRDDNSIW